MFLFGIRCGQKQNEIDAFLKPEESRESCILHASPPPPHIPHLKIARYLIHINFDLPEFERVRHLLRIRHPASKDRMQKYKLEYYYCLLYESLSKVGIFGLYGYIWSCSGTMALRPT